MANTAGAAAAAALPPWQRERGAGSVGIHRRHHAAAAPLQRLPENKEKRAAQAQHAGQAARADEQHVYVELPREKRAPSPDVRRQ